SVRYGALTRADKFRTNRLALSLRVNHAGQLGQESIRFMRRTSLRTGRGHKVFCDLLALTRAQQTMVDEYTGQTVANGALHQRSSNCRVHAAGQTTNSAAFRADLLADVIDKLLGNIGRCPTLLQTCHLGEKAREHFLAMRR